MKLLKEKYKTYEGAAKRRNFENALALGEYQRGYKAHHYVYTVVSEDGAWRVKREQNGQQD